MAKMPVSKDKSTKRTVRSGGSMMGDISKAFAPKPAARPTRGASAAPKPYGSNSFAEFGNFLNAKDKSGRDVGTTSAMRKTGLKKAVAGVKSKTAANASKGAKNTGMGKAPTIKAIPKTY